jgi:hypothetical protein
MAMRQQQKNLEIRGKRGKILYKGTVRSRNIIVSRIIKGREKERTQRESKNKSRKE